MGKTANQLAAIWSKLGVNQKATILLLTVGLLVGIVALVHISRRPSYELLYSDLEEKDMAQVVTYLRESKVPYTFSNGGKAVMVPEGRKYDLRLGMADKGTLPGSRVGLELWQAPGWGASPLAEQMMKRRAIQGELARTIMHIEQVAWADVQIAQPEQSLFTEEARPATAAVSLRIHRGRSLTPVQVAGITRLVGASIEGLDPKNVTIIDEQGNLLTSPRSDTSTAHAADAHGYRRLVEEHLASKAQAMLDRALGAGKSVIKVSATLDMDQVSETRETIDAANRTARTEKVMSKSGPAGEGSGAMSEETTETAYDVPKSVRTTLTAPGAVRRLDVAVIIDPSYLDKDGKEATLTQTQKDDLTQLVRRAVGIDDTRKDTFQTTFMPFVRPVAPAGDAVAQDPVAQRQYILQIARYASSALAVIVFVTFAGITLRRTMRHGASAPQGPGSNGSPAYIEAEFMALGGNGNGQAHLKNRVKELMARDPALAAKLLQRWMTDEETKKGK